MTDFLWTSLEIALATGGRLSGKFGVGGIVIDAVNTKPGDLYVELGLSASEISCPLSLALEKGAAGALVAGVPQNMPVDDPRLIHVDDPETALVHLARAARKRSSAHVIAVAGSVGKTCIVEALKLALLPSGHTFAAPSTERGHLDTVLALACLPENIEYAIFELGMRWDGELSILSDIVRPDTALITNVGPAHVQNFENMDEVAAAKAGIFDGMGEGGTAILNRDNPYSHKLAQLAEKAGIARIVTASALGNRAQAQTIQIVPSSTCNCLKARILGQDITFKIGVPGEHWVINALQILLAVKICGADLAKAAIELASFSGLEGRGLISSVEFASGRFLIIDDSSSADPMGMRAALAVLSELKPATSEGRRIAVLADMDCPPEQALKHHLALADQLRAARIKRVFVQGPMMRALLDRVTGNISGLEFDDPADLLPILTRQIVNGDILLVKGGAKSGLREVVQRLLAMQAPGVDDVVSMRQIGIGGRNAL